MFKKLHGLWIVMVARPVLLLPCLRAPGGGVPGFLASLALSFVVCFTHDPNAARLAYSQVVSPVSLAKWASPQFESIVQIFNFPS